MIDIICKTVRPTHLKKLQITQNINNLMFQVPNFLQSFLLLGKQIFEKTVPGRMSNFPLPKV